MFSKTSVSDFLGEGIGELDVPRSVADTSEEVC